MSKFFERGNLALDWEFVEGDFVAVDGGGYAWPYYGERPVSFSDDWRGAFGELIGRVGAPCPDWRELLFERPRAPRLPDGFWEACDMVYGETCEWATLDADSDTPYVYSAKPALRSDGVYTAYSGNVGAVSGVVITGVDYKDSLTRRPFLRIGQTEADE